MPDATIIDTNVASIDHYSHARGVVENVRFAKGLAIAKAFLVNAGYSMGKFVDFPVPRDTSRPNSPKSLDQWMIGNLGAVDGLLLPSDKERGSREAR